MQTLNRIFGILAIVTLAGCVSNGATDIFASADEPHVVLGTPTLQALREGDIYPVKLMRIDGRTISLRDGSSSGDRFTSGQPARDYNPHQREFWRLNPGEHVIGLEADRQMILTFLPKGRLDSSVPGYYEEQTVRVTLEAGKTYTFGAEIQGEDYTGWRPVILEVASDGSVRRVN